MKYTENYHLPQWVKTDRIMMDDFNQMCADLEAGMTENAQTAADVRQNSDQLDQKTLERLWRLAYNHYTAVQDMDPFPWQVGVFHQNPVKDKSGVTGAQLLNGVCFAGRIPAGTTAGSFENYAEEISQMTLVKNNLAACTPLQVNICTPMNTYVNQIVMSGNISGNVSNTPFPVKLTLTNLDTGELEASCLLDMAQRLETGSMINDGHDCFLAFYAGQHYRLQIEPLAAVFNGYMHIQLTSTYEKLLYLAPDTASLSASHTMREHEGSSGGLLVVRGLVHGGSLTASWDGQTVPLHTTRMVRLDDGRMVREMAYYREGPIPAETTFSLAYDPGERGAFLFYDWGAVLL